MTKFQKEFKKLRTEYNMTQAELAKALNVSRSTIGMYEQGKREPDFETLEKISDFFNVSMSVFLEDQMTDCDLLMSVTDCISDCDLLQVICIFHSLGDFVLTYHSMSDIIIT